MLSHEFDPIMKIHDTKKLLSFYKSEPSDLTEFPLKEVRQQVEDDWYDMAFLRSSWWSNQKVWFFWVCSTSWYSKQKVEDDGMLESTDPSG